MPLSKKKRTVQGKRTKLSNKKKSQPSSLPGENQISAYSKKIIITSLVFVLIGLAAAVWSYLSIKGVVG